MAQGATKQAARQRAATSVADWKRRAIHAITLPSGAEVKVRIPDLVLLTKGNAVPQNLRAAALVEMTKQLTGRMPDLGGEDDSPIDEELLSQIANLQEWLVLEAVVEPALSADDLAEIPTEDKAMITAISGRERATDARGVRLGVDPLAGWATFRLRHGLERCPEDCSACQQAGEDLSTLDMG